MMKQKMEHNPAADASAIDKLKLDHTSIQPTAADN
jgi:hypothetical protein